jgi:hypothetical protein
MTSEIVAILEKMQAISLDEMESIRLMDRIDSKFVAPVSLLPTLLEEMFPYFRVQIINDKRIAPYCTQYFDTPNLEMFVMHQNRKLNRQKIRIRSYTDSNLSFLEVKNKNNKGRTSKIRVPIQQSHLNSIDELDDEKQFLEKNSHFNSDNLVPVLGNNFNRITLVNNRKTERITIDVDLSFTNYKTENEKSLDKLMILELKQDGWKHSDFRDILNRMRIKKISFSKYCIGTFLTNPKINTANPEIKYNRFKKKIRTINKLIQ